MPASLTIDREMSRPQHYNSFLLLGWYLLFGALHELSHVLVAFGLGFVKPSALSMASAPHIVMWVVRLALERRCQFPIPVDGADDDNIDGPVVVAKARIALVRHAGWVFSSVLAAAIYYFYAKKSHTSSSAQQHPLVWAAVLTALEAVSTDLLGLGIIPLLGTRGSHVDAGNHMLTFFCGNFGLILLNPAWNENGVGKRTALDMLQKMINVTMVRGAQSAGVVTFVNRSQRHNDQLVGIRSRVVNSKRSDLSVKIRKKVASDEMRMRITSSCGGSYESDSLVKTYVGHTRFATSSIASFDGTHPHQWSPPRRWQMYDVRGPHTGRKSLKIVENFITHNGDFDAYEIQGKSYPLDSVQAWLEEVTSYEMPSAVDSAAIAGMVDILHCQGSFALSIRYAVCLGLRTSKIGDSTPKLPSYLDYSNLAQFFETALDQQLKRTGHKLSYISAAPEERGYLESLIISILGLELRENGALIPFAPFLTDIEGGATVAKFVRCVVDAFFDNDLFWTVKTFLHNARGSFGICVTSSLSAHRQLCLASRGQTNSVAFFPKSGVVAYGSEQSAVKAGLSFPTPGGDLPIEPGDNNDRPLRLDLDDLNGEIALLDWGEGEDYALPAVSAPNRHLPVYKLMNGRLNLVLHQESKGTEAPLVLHHRMTLIDPADHELMKPLPSDTKDPILQDIRDIPRVCRAIQDDWRGFSTDTSLNRLTAWNLTKCLQKRMSDIHQKKMERQPGSVDILLTGCEVSLWLAEQFASDLQKAFPKLGVKGMSSNKFLGLFGQDFSVPSIGFPYSQRSHDFKDAIVIIVSHSGGTFGPLACSNLLQSLSENIFCVTSEWDTQVAKQLRAMHSEKDHIVNSRIFTTDVGLRPAEPCSVSVAATQQLLTNIFEHICIVVLSNPHYREASGAVITERDLEELERCNQENIGALEQIVGFDSDGRALSSHTDEKSTEKELRDAGAVWAKHILENAKATIIVFIYIFATVTTGFPIARAISEAISVNNENYYYLIGFIDSAIFFFMPQMAITMIRLLERRNLRHRMVGRTVVIGDCPWVAQAAEAFLSKIFAVSYSIAGLNVLSGNPADHLVHRHTHRVVRGSLLICGRPDGRLSALTSLEQSVALSVNQASSIQSLGGTCESLTIGHNPFVLPLSKGAIFLKRTRPMYLCERLLGELDLEARVEQRRLRGGPRNRPSLRPQGSDKFTNKITNADPISSPLTANSRSAAALQGAYHNLQKEASRGRQQRRKSRSTSIAMEVVHQDTIEDVVAEAIDERKREANLRNIFDEMDENGDGFLSEDEFVRNYFLVDSTLNEEQVRKIFKEADHDGAGSIDYDKFLRIAEMPQLQMLRILQTINRPRSLLQVEASREIYFGENLRHEAPDSVGVLSLERSQHFSMELYESRIASMQRFVSMCVMFHEMGRMVENFFSKLTFGLLGYRYDRTHSILRVASTASPISGADVRERVHLLRLSTKVKRSIEAISFAWNNYKQKKHAEAISNLKIT